MSAGAGKLPTQQARKLSVQSGRHGSSIGRVEIDVLRQPTVGAGITQPHPGQSRAAEEPNRDVQPSQGVEQMAEMISPYLIFRDPERGRDPRQLTGYQHEFASACQGLRGPESSRSVLLGREPLHGWPVDSGCQGTDGFVGVLDGEQLETIKIGQWRLVPLEAVHALVERLWGTEQRNGPSPCERRRVDLPA